LETRGRPPFGREEPERPCDEFRHCQRKVLTATKVSQRSGGVRLIA
jgi:hypothetical protein